MDMPGISDEKKARVRAAWDDLIVVVAEGGNIGEACERHGITRHDVRHYRLQDARAELEWQSAREQSADEYADKVGEIASNPDLDAARARVKLDALRWLAAKRNPAKYSDKQQLDVNVKTIDLTRTIQEANARLAQAQRPALRDVTDAEILPAALLAKPHDLF